MVSVLKCQNSLPRNLTNKGFCVARRTEPLAGGEIVSFPIHLLLFFFINKASFYPSSEQGVDEKIRLFKKIILSWKHQARCSCYSVMYGLTMFSCEERHPTPCSAWETAQVCVNSPRFNFSELTASQHWSRVSHPCSPPGWIVLSELPHWRQRDYFSYRYHSVWAKIGELNPELLLIIITTVIINQPIFMFGKTVHVPLIAKQIMQ